MALVLLLLIIGAAILPTVVQSKSIQWTGYAGDSQWTNPVNWDSNTVPTMLDDVTIGAGTVQVTIGTGVNSLVLGTKGAANLTIFQAFTVPSVGNGLYATALAALIVNSGAAVVTGNVTIAGGLLVFNAGAIGGTWNVFKSATLDWSSSGAKTLNSGTFTLVNLQSFTIGGVLSMNQSGTFKPVCPSITFVGATLTHDPFLQPSSAVLFDFGKVASSVLRGQITVISATSFGPVEFSSTTTSSIRYIPQNSSSLLTFQGDVTGNGTLSLSSGLTQFLSTLRTFSGSMFVLGGTTVLRSSSPLMYTAQLVVSSVLQVASPGTISRLQLTGGTIIATAPVTVLVALVDLSGGSMGDCTNTSSRVPLTVQQLIVNYPLTICQLVTLQSMGNISKSLIINSPWSNLPALIVSPTAILNLLDNAQLLAGGTLLNNGLIRSFNGVRSQVIMTGNGSMHVHGKIYFSGLSASLRLQDVVLQNSSSALQGDSTSIDVGVIRNALGGPVHGTFGHFEWACGVRCENIRTGYKIRYYLFTPGVFSQRQPSLPKNSSMGGPFVRIK